MLAESSQTKLLTLGQGGTCNRLQCQEVSPIDLWQEIHPLQ